MAKPKVGIILSHPIQHFCPKFKSYATSKLFLVKVFFASRIGVEIYHDKDFNTSVKWHDLYLDSYNHMFLNDGAVIPVNESIDAPNLSKQLEIFNPDALLLYGYGKKYQRRAFFWAKKNKKKIIYMSDSELRGQRSFLKKIAKRIILPYYFKNIDVFFTAGNANEEYLLHYKANPGKFVRSSFPINIHFYKQAFIKKNYLKANIRHRYNIKIDEIICSVVGKVISFKGQQDLIKALIILEQVYNLDNIVLFIIGSGPMLKGLQNKSVELKKNKIIFTGFVESVSLADYYAATDIYIHPSHFEPHSLSISEASFMGCPLLISDRCGSWGSTDDLQPGKNGITFRTGDVNDLAIKLKTLIENPEKLKIYSKNSIEISHSSQRNIHYNAMEAALTIAKLL